MKKTDYTVEQRFRQGDMLLFRISDADAARIKANAAKKIENAMLTVGVGEVTGHSHDVLEILPPGADAKTAKTNITAYLEKETESLDNIPAIQNLFFELEEAGIIVHDEHNPIHLEKGFYVRVNQREYNPFTSMYQQVRD